MEVPAVDKPAKAPATFGSLLKRYRLAAGLSHEKLAERANLHPRTISDLERDLKRPRNDTFEVLADALKLGVEERALLARAVARSRATSKPTGASTAFEPRLALDRQLRSNLPAQTTPLIGRKRELAEIAENLATTRLLTLTGAGGCGKTTLALEAARNQDTAYADGVWLVELAAQSDPRALPRVAAAALGVREVPGEPTMTTLSAFLRRRQLLLIVDNCEHLISEVSSFIADLLRVCPELHVLTTSREPLAIAGEIVWRVPSLATPPTDGPADEIGDYAAVRLFVARAAAIQHDFTLTAWNAAAVAQICTRLDGIPLAIELAAGWVVSLDPRQIALRLDDRFRLLVRAPRASVPRHQTLRAAIDWSHKLLDESERILFRRLAVFTGSFSLEAAEEVGADAVEDNGGDRSIAGKALMVRSIHLASADVLDLLGRLVDKSLVQVDPVGPENRYRFLETVREYALERLDDADEVAVQRARHRDWCLVLAERGDQELRGAAQGEWLGRFEAEADNLSATLDWCESEPGQAETGLRLAVALWWFWYVRDRLTEGQTHLERLLTQAKDASPDVRAKALWRTGFLALWAQANGRSEELCQTALALCRDIGDDVGIAWATSILGQIALRRGDQGLARNHLEGSLALFRVVGDPWSIAGAVSDLGSLASAERDYHAAETYHAEALAIRRSLGDSRGMAVSLRLLGYVAYMQEDYSAARSFYAEAMELARASLNTSVLSYCLVGLGDTLVQLGDHAAAETYLLEAEALARATGNRERGASSLWSLGLLLRVQGRQVEVLQRFRESLRLYLGIGMSDVVRSHNIVTTLLDDIAGIIATQGDTERAAILYGAADGLRVSVSATEDLESDPADAREVARHRRYVRAEMGFDAFTAAWNRGRTLEFEAVLSQALDEDDVGGQ